MLSFTHLNPAAFNIVKWSKCVFVDPTKFVFDGDFVE